MELEPSCYFDFIKSNIPNFFDFICIEKKQFKKYNYDVEQTMNENKEIFLFSDDFSEKKNFDKMFNKFINVIENNFIKVVKFIELFDHDIRTKVLEIINNKKYTYISPDYILSLHIQAIDNSEIIKDLDVIISEFEIVNKAIKTTIQKIFTNHMCTFSGTTKQRKQTLIAQIENEMFPLYEKLIDLHIYAIPEIIIKNIMLCGYETYLDSIYEKKQNDII